jgi:phage host-nuclease inhibitor protein Gam
LLGDDEAGNSCRRGYPTASCPTALEAIQFVSRFAFERFNRDRKDADKIKELSPDEIKAYLRSHKIEF